MTLILLFHKHVVISFEPRRSRGLWLSLSQAKISWENKDFTYIDLYRKSYEYETDPEKKTRNLYSLRAAEARRDFFLGSLKPINHLIQFDQKPNQNLKEVRSEIYKISVSFKPKRKLLFKTIELSNLAF